MRFVRHPGEDTPRGHAKDAIERLILLRGQRIGDKLPTFRDLAQHLGIAVLTVVRAMHQLADEGVVQILHGKGAFVRKLPAGGGKLIQVGLVYPASRLHLVRTPYLNQILAGVIDQCDRNHIDLQIVAFRQAGQPAYTPISPRDVAMRVDGVLLLEVVNEQYIAEFAKESIPLVLVDIQASSVPLAAVCVDNAAAVRQVMDHLYNLGHRRIAYLDGQSQDPLARPGQLQWVDSPDGKERREAYLAETRRLRLNYQRIYPAHNESVKSAEVTARQLKQDRQRPTAVLAYDEPVAGHLCESLEKLGLRVPHDLSVAGAAGAEGANVAGQLVVTCAITRFEEMGQLAMKALLAQAGGKPSRNAGVQRVGSQLSAGHQYSRPAKATTLTGPLVFVLVFLAYCQPLTPSSAFCCDGNPSGRES